MHVSFEKEKRRIHPQILPGKEFRNVFFSMKYVTKKKKKKTFLSS